MKRIASFSVDHTKLQCGVYVSIKQYIGDLTITTFDIRMCRPNIDPVMNTGAIHAIEHIGATYLRNDGDYKDKVIYFGPMGCRTGFYLVLAGDYHSRDIIPLLKSLFSFISEFEGNIPGASPSECGNYKDMDLDEAKEVSRLYLYNVLTNITDEQLNYTSFLEELN